MVDVAQLRIEADSRSIKTANRDLDQFSRTGSRAEKSAGSLASAVKLASAAFVAFGAARSLKGIITEHEQLQRNLLRTDQLIQTTGRQARRSAEGMHQQARALAAATLESTEGIMQAQQTLLTFRNITADTFDQTIEGALDLASSMGIDLNSAVLQLGKALEDPITGMTALTRSGTVFTQAQKDMVKELVETGRAAEAQQFILGELSDQYGGVAKAETEGLAGAQDSLAQAIQEVKISLGEELVPVLEDGARAMTDFLNAVDVGEVVDNLAAAVEALALVFAARLTPSILATVNAKRLAVVETIRYEAALASMAGVSRTAAVRQTALAGAVGAARGAMALVGGPVGAAVIASYGVYKLVDAAIEADKELKATTESLREFIKVAEPMSDVLNDAVNDALTDAEETAASATESIHAFNAELDLTVPVAEKATRSLASYQRAQNDLIEKHFPLTRAANDYNDSLEELWSLLTTGAISYDEFQDAQERVTAGYQEQRDRIEGTTDATDDLTDAQDRAAESAEEMGETYRNMIEGIQRGWADSIYDMLDEGEIRFDSFFDTVLDGYKRMLSEMASRNMMDMMLGNKEFSLSGIMDGTGGPTSALLNRIPGFDSFAGNSGLSDIFGSFNTGPDAGSSLSEWGDFGTDGKMFDGGQLASGLKTMGLNIGASWAGGEAGEAMGEAIFNKTAESNIGQTIGSAIGTAVGGPIGAAIGAGIGSMVDVATGGDGKVRNNSGFVMSGTSGLKSEYDVGDHTFASGVEVDLFSRRSDPDSAREIMEVFDKVDSAYVDLVKELGGSVSVASLNGLDEEANAGSNGTFFGMGGNGENQGDINAQLDSWIDQLTNSTSGLSDELLENARAAKTAEEALSVLGAALVEQEALKEAEKLLDKAEPVRAATRAYQEDLESLAEVYEKGSADYIAAEKALKEVHGVSGIAAETIRETVDMILASSESEHAAMKEILRLTDEFGGSIEEVAAAMGVSAQEAEAWIKRVTEAEERLMKVRMDGVTGLVDELDSIDSLRRSMEMQIYELMGADPLFDFDATITEQISHIEDMRSALVKQHQDEIRAEEKLHETRLSLAQDFSDFINGVQLGSMSNLNPQEQLSLAQGNFRDLADAAQGGDMDALKQLQGAAEQYIDEADNMFASSKGRKDVVSEVMGIMDGLSADLAASEFDPSAANAALIDELRALDQELADISLGVNDSIIAELQKIQGSIDELPPELASMLSAVAGNWAEGLYAEGMSAYDIADQVKSGSLKESATNQYLADTGQGVVHDSDFLPHVPGGAVNEDSIRAVYQAAMDQNKSSDEVAEALGFTRQEVLDAASSLGLPSFSGGGIAFGPQSGYLAELHGSEAVIPMQGGSIPVQINNSEVVTELRGLRSELKSEISAVRKEMRGQSLVAAEQRQNIIRIEEQSNDELSRMNQRRSAGGNIG